MLRLKTRRITSSRPRARGRGTPACAARAGRRRSAPAVPPRGSLPLSRKQTLFAISRAKPISCVAMIIVMPTSVRSRTSCRTSVTSCGSSALVISSSSISFGLHGQRADDRHALLLAAGEPVGEGVGLVAQADPVEQLVRRGRRPGASRRLRDLARCERHVLEHRHVREEVERLEDDADLAAQRVHVDLALGDRLAVDDDRALLTASSRLRQRSSVDLPEPDAPIRHTTSCSATVRLDLVEHRVLAEALGHVLDLHECRIGHAVRSASSRSRRSIRPSVKRASGIVMQDEQHRRDRCSR